jgi:cruciform cutting endonuclease 1
MALKIPNTLKLAELRSVASKCGLQTSGAKPILTQRVHDEITSSPKRTKKTRVLSVDMGIRNLAYCILDVPSKSVSKSVKDPDSEVPSLRAWHRLSVSNSIPGEKEAFDPTTLSNIAYRLLRTRLIPEEPTHVLIERQRFRSMGSKHILEWTIRVNMFESILYGVLCTLKAEGIWKGEVVGVAPGKVGPFWLSEEGDEGERGKQWKKERKAKSSKSYNKGLKIDLVRRWLEDGQVVGLGSEEVIETARQYMDKWDRIPGRRNLGRVKEKEEEIGKLDDLADCLLQGMAWIKWQENKTTALKDGVEALLKQKAPLII